MERTINIHSLVDVITNSSTEIFIMIKSGGVEMAYEILNHILKIGESPLRAEDLFDISIERDWYAVKEAYFYDLDYRSRYEKFTEREDAIAHEYRSIKSRTEGDRQEQNRLLGIFREEKIHPFVEENREFVVSIIEGSEYGGQAQETRLKIVTSENPDVETLDIFQKFMNLFRMEELER